jgi:hypothetical protein
MGMKNGFLTIIMEVLASMFKNKSGYGMNDPFQPKAPISQGEVHITSSGSAPVYGKLPRKEFYQKKADARRKKHEAMVWELKQEGIIWVNNKLYWATRVLAIQNS